MTRPIEILFKRLRCTFACCSGVVIVQNSVEDGKNTSGCVLQSAKQECVQWKRKYLPCCKKADTKFEAKTCE